MDTLQNKYGYFDPENREYVITDPKTPRAWINYIGGTGKLDAFVSNRAGGTAWYCQPHTGRLTRYQYMALPEDNPGFFLYIKDGKTLWNPSYAPVCTDLDSYECRHGLYETRFKSAKDNLLAEVRYLIPAEDAVMLWDVTFTNTGTTEKVFSAYPYQDFSMRDMTKDVLHFHFCGNQMTGSYLPEANALMLDYFAFEAHYPGFTLFNASKPFSSFDMDRSAFIGRCRSEANPERLITGELTNTQVPGSGYCICGVFRLDFRLAPGASERVIIKLAVSPDLKEAETLLKKYDDPAEVDAAAETLRRQWNDILSKNQVHTPDPGLNEMINVWLPKNIRTTMRCGRSISQRHTGTGTSNCFRDSMQDIMAGTIFFPEAAKKQILLLMRSVRKSGQITYSIDPVNFTCLNPDHIRCDAVVWGIFTIAKYIAETDDHAILQTSVTDYDGGESTVLDLLFRAMHFSGTQVGKHGLPKLFNCDWNDSLVVVSAFLHDGESIMVAMQYICAARILLGLLDGRTEEKTFLEERIRTFTRILDSSDVWDGNWYRRLLFPSGKMGSADNEEGRLFLNTQTWAMLAGTLSKEHTEHALASVAEKLNTPYGLQLFTPPFTRLMDGRRYCGNAPGAGENSGLFYHANTWAVIAEALAGNAEKAWEYFQHVMPNCRSGEDPDLYEREPYAFASWVYGPDNASYGKAALSHLTGGASWIYQAVTEYLLGIRPEPGFVRFAPCIPASWDGFTAERTIAGNLYHIEVINPEHHTGPSVSLTVNGNPVEGNRIPHAPRGTELTVKATIL